MVNRIQQKFQRSKPIIQAAILLIIVFLILVMFSSFTKFSTYSLVNLNEKESFVGGEKVKFAIYLTTTDPEQFKTETHYRVQYGRWRFEDLSGKLISPGKITTLTRGIYNAIVEVNVPHENSVFVSEIIEYQYAKSSEGKWVRDEGTVKEVQTYNLYLETCYDASECSGSLCSGKLTRCEQSLCISYGECLSCQNNFDCPESNECLNGACYEIQETNVITEIKTTLTGTINEPGLIQDGQPVAQTAPSYLIILTIIMWIVLGLLIWQIKKQKKKMF